MSIRDMEGTVQDNISVRNVLISVFNKDGLDTLVEGLMILSPEVMFYSTGGTYKRLLTVLDESADNHLMEVSEYTGAPEMEGGLVKTLHPLVHGGILGERGNSAHAEYLAQFSRRVETVNVDEDLIPADETFEARMVSGPSGVYMDLVVVNLYPFADVISREDSTFEKARGNIDIGGPTMLMSAAKNFPSCAPVCNPKFYSALLTHMKDNGGCTAFDMRATLARAAFRHVGQYRQQIAEYMTERLDNPKEVRREYGLE